MHLAENMQKKSTFFDESEVALVLTRYEKEAKAVEVLRKELGRKTRIYEDEVLKLEEARSERERILHHDEHAKQALESCPELLELFQRRHDEILTSLQQAKNKLRSR